MAQEPGEEEEPNRQVWNTMFGTLESEEDDQSYQSESSDEERNKESENHLGNESAPSSPDSSKASSMRAGPGKARTLVHEMIQKQNAEELEALEIKDADDMLLLEQKDGGSRTPLHVCLLSGYPDMLEKLLTKAGEAAATRMLQQRFRSKKDDLPPLHLALSMAPFEKRLHCAERCVRIVLDAAKKHEIDLIASKDGYGKEALHYACDFGRPSIVKQLLDAGANPMAKDSQDQMPLHLAIDSYNIETLKIILPLTDVQKAYSQFHPVLRCIRKGNWKAVQEFHDLKWLEDDDTVKQIGVYASRHGMGGQWQEVLTQARSSMEIVPQKLPQTVLITHSDCFNHLAIPEDCDDPDLRMKLIDQAVENPHRLEVIAGQYGALRAQEFEDVTWKENAAECPIGDILRVHEYHYIYNLIGAIEKLTETGRRRFSWVTFDRSDTRVSKESLHAARRAAGCVLEAVDTIMNSPPAGDKDAVRNVFCALRPPGHHAGPAGAVDPNDVTKDEPLGSQGFCLLNNVAIGAAYARCLYRNRCKKVAIIDFDVHHGNGTEAICRNVTGRKGPITEELFMNTGARSTIRTEGPPLAKPWLDTVSDKDNVFFASIHGYGKGFYPGSGDDSHLMPPESPEIVNVALAPGTESVDLRKKFHTRIIPHLINFNPDLIFISAGFDGHSNDLIGCCEYLDEDYVWMTQELMKVANQCCQGRIVSVLEGGYNTRAGVLSPFASCVKSHIRTLMNSSESMKFQEGLEDEQEGEWNEQYIAPAPRRSPRQISRENSPKRAGGSSPRKGDQGGPTDENDNQVPFADTRTTTMVSPPSIITGDHVKTDEEVVREESREYPLTTEPLAEIADKKRPGTPEVEKIKRAKLDTMLVDTAPGTGEKDSEMDEVFGTNDE